MASNSSPTSSSAPRWVGVAFWVWPLVASLCFVAGVLLWAYRADQLEQQLRRDTMIADALSAEAQLRAQLDAEKDALARLAAELKQAPRSSQSLLAANEVTQGLRRHWISVTWLDANRRIVAQVPPGLSDAGGPGISSHLSASLGDGLLVVRYSVAQLLRKGAPWWLVRKYELQLIDSSEQVLASVDDLAVGPDVAGHESYRVAVGGGLPGAYLGLYLREAALPFWRTLPLVLIAGFLALMALATYFLRRQMLRITAAELAWRTDAGWRRAMEDSALVGLRARDAQGRILYVNRTFCDMVGLEAEALVGLTPPMPYWPANAIEEVMVRHQRNLAGQAPREGYEAVWRHRDGHLLDVMVFESPLIDAQGQQSGWMGSIIDITERKQLQAREHHRAQAMDQQARLTTLGEVASALAHQLNQPLTAIMGYNAGLQRMLGQSDNASPTVMSALQQQGQQAAEAGKIVRRIREFLTRRSPEREACDLSQLARHACELLGRDLSNLHIKLLWSVPENLPFVDADPVLMEQVVINLVRNAADALATQPGKRHIRVVLASYGPGSLRLTVEDNGPGLQGRTVEEICAPFYSTKSSGMGMGLAICRSVVEAHHGSMQAGVSEWGGAQISLTLPLAAEAALAA